MGQQRPAASVSDAIGALDDLIATSVIGQQEFARDLGLSVTDLICFAHVLAAGESAVTAGDLAARARHHRRGDRHPQPPGARRVRHPGARPADRRRVRVVAAPAAADRVQAVCGPYYARLAELLSQHTPDEIAVVTDWFVRAAALARTYLDESCEAWTERLDPAKAP